MERHEVRARSDAGPHQDADHSVFLGGRGIDLVGSLDDAIGKESFGGVAMNHRMAFAVFGIDFTSDVAEFLGVQSHQAVRCLKRWPSVPTAVAIPQADQLITTGQVGRFVAPLLETWPCSRGHRLGWVERLDTENSVEAQITAAMMIYLMTPGAQVDYVLSPGGINDLSSSLDSVMRLMPPVFTQVSSTARRSGRDCAKNINKPVQRADLQPEGRATAHGYSLSTYMASISPSTTNPAAAGRHRADQAYRGIRNLKTAPSSRCLRDQVP